MSVYQQWEELKLPEISDSQLFVLAESNQNNTLLAQMEFHHVEYKSLWHLQQMPELERYAPYLINVERYSAFDQWLSQNSQDVPFTMIKARMSFEKLVLQLKHFSKFEDAQINKRYFLRLGSSPMLHLYVNSVADDLAAIEKLFANGQIHGYLFQNKATNLLQYYRSHFEKEPQEQLSYQQNGYLKWLNLNEVV